MQDHIDSDDRTDVTDAERNAGTYLRREDETYNGWKNYPTWAVNMWLSNDEPLYREALRQTEAMLRLYEPGSESGAWSADAPRYQVADFFKNWVTDELAPDLGATFAADLLSYALGCVDWYEIADAWIESAKESVAGVEP